VVTSRWPLWERDAERYPVLTGIRSNCREVLRTTVLDAEPQGTVVLPAPSAWPFVLALAVAIGFIGFMFHPAWLAVGFAGSFLAILGWLWPDPTHWRHVQERA
jgi:cytochrome c oxidase subunit I+III